MSKKNDPVLSNGQEVAQDVREATEEEILAGVTGGVGEIRPFASTSLPKITGGSRFYETLPFGLRVSRTAPPPRTLNVSPTSAFKRYIPDLNQPPAKRQKTGDS